MRIGYGYERAESLFSGLDVGRVLIDTNRTYRTERASLFTPGMMRPGDTVVLLALGDLGKGFGLTRFRAMLEAVGVELEICPPDVAHAKRGRPATFNPDDQQQDQIRTLWRDPAFTLAYVLKRTGEIMGYEVRRHQLSHRYGKREKQE